MDIDIQTICGQDTLSRDAGKILREHILANWSQAKLRLFAKGRVIASVSFFDESIGMLMKMGNKPWPEVRAKLEFPDLSKEDRALLNSVVKQRRDNP